MDNFWKNLSVRPVLFVIFSTILSQASHSCDLQKVQTCFTDAEATIRILLDRPFNTEKLSLIQHKYCPSYSIDRSENCLFEISRGCTSEDLAPYNLLRFTSIVVCFKDMDPRKTCRSGFYELMDAIYYTYMHIYEENWNKCSFYQKLIPTIRLWLTTYCRAADDLGVVDGVLANRFFPYLSEIC